MGQHGTHIGGRAEQVLLEHGPQRGIRDLFGGADLSGAGIVDEHVDAPEHLQRPLYDRGRSRCVAYIVLNGEEPVPVPRLEPVEPVDPSRGPDHKLAGRECRLGERQAESRTRARDDPCLRLVRRGHGPDTKASSALESKPRSGSCASASRCRRPAP
ncbi:hypothetical protein GCM10020295_80710 [Streptomyces cinereospinus]